ncbi:MAG: replicative DNA helicase [Ruminococcus sp.]|nr:replicative DNA helicase [Ruminococcus sp.]
MAGADSLENVYELLNKEPPFSQLAERSVIGGMLRFPEEAVPSAVELLKAEFFYEHLHQQMFSLIVNAYSDNKGFTVIDIINELVKRGLFTNEDMAKTFIMGLSDYVASVKNIESYCKLIIEKYNVRKLLSVATDIIDNVNEGTMDATSMLDIAEQKIYDIRQGKEIDGLTRLDSILVETYAHLEEISGPEAKEHLGARTGFAQIDEITTGLNNTDLIIIAARPAVGKSAFAINIATNVCKKTQKDVVIFSLEMGKEQLASRMLATEALVNNTSLRSGKFEKNEWERLAEATIRLSKLPMYIDDTGSVTVPQMKAKLRRVKNLGLVVIDYIQLMESPNKGQGRVNEVSEITRQLKLMAKELNVPVIALSQLSRAVEKNERKPMLSDLRDSGSIEQDADIIMFLHRDYYGNDADRSQSEADCIIAKNRHGTMATVKLAWIGEYTLFRGMDIRHDDIDQ